MLVQIGTTIHFPEGLENTPFHEKILRIGDFEKRAFFELAILNFFFKKFFFFFFFFSLKSSQIFMVEWIGQIFFFFLCFRKIPRYA